MTEERWEEMSYNRIPTYTNQSDRLYWERELEEECSFEYMEILEDCYDEESEA